MTIIIANERFETFEIILAHHTIAYQYKLDVTFISLIARMTMKAYSQ